MNSAGILLEGKVILCMRHLLDCSIIGLECVQELLTNEENAGWNQAVPKIDYLSMVRVRLSSVKFLRDMVSGQAADLDDRTNAMIELLQSPDPK